MDSLRRSFRDQEIYLHFLDVKKLQERCDLGDAIEVAASMYPLKELLPDLIKLKVVRD